MSSSFWGWLTLAFGIGVAICTGGGFWSKFMWDRAKEREELPQPATAETAISLGDTHLNVGANYGVINNVPATIVEKPPPAAAVSRSQITATISIPKKLESGLFASDVTITNRTGRAALNVTVIDFSYREHVLKMHPSGLTFQNAKPRVIHAGYSTFWGELPDGGSRSFRMSWEKAEFYDACLGIVFELKDRGQLLVQDLVLEVSSKDGTGEYSAFRPMSDWERVDRKGYEEAYRKAVPDVKRQMDVRP